MLDIAPIPEKVLYINGPWLIDISFDGMEKVSEEPDPNPDNVRVYLPLNLNAEAILRRLRYVIYRYGEANEANESDLCDRGTVLLLFHSRDSQVKDFLSNNIFRLRIYS